MRHGLRAATLVAALLGVCVAGCGGPRQAQGPARITLWTQMDPEERARFEENLDAFRAAHPGVEIEYVPYDTENLRQQFQTAAAAGGGPQIIFGPSDQVGPLSLIGVIRPLDEVMPAGFFDRFVPQALDTLGGHLWAAPDQVGNHLTLVYNRALVPEPPETWDEFMALARRLTRPAGGGQPARYGFAMNVMEPYWLVPFLAGYGGWVMDADRNPTLDTPAMRQALALLADLKNRSGVMPRESDYQVAETLFKEGQAAMIVNGPWSWSAYRKAGIDVGVAPIPRLPNGAWAAPMTASKGYSINANVPDAELPRVVELVEFLTSAEAQRRRAVELGTLPSHADAYADSAIANDPTLQASRRAFALGRRMPVVPEMRVLWDVMRPGLQQVMAGARTPEEAAREMQAQAVQQIAGMRR
uniref:Extracellular solute-binding protein n=1 Tax=Eiseniibacteriota bacterium TaxID=2212470 RepID=A0A832I176_UNCEI